jgi:hypothetical protein
MPQYILKNEDGQPKPKLTLSLVPNGPGGSDVTLVAEDEDGAEWHLLALTKEGQLVLYSEISETLGLKIDADGYLNVRKE